MATTHVGELHEYAIIAFRKFCISASVYVYMKNKSTTKYRYLHIKGIRCVDGALACKYNENRSLTNVTGSDPVPDSLPAVTFVGTVTVVLY
jgi:hypothetical protein